MDLSKYPHAKRFFEQHPDMSLDEALEYVDKQLEEYNHEGKARKKISKPA